MSAGDLVVAALLLDLEGLVDRRERVVPELAERLQAAAGLARPRLLFCGADRPSGVGWRSGPALSASFIEIGSSRPPGPPGAAAPGQ